MKIKRDKNYIQNVLLIAIPLVFYIFFWIYDGAIWCADSASYVDMKISREPLYPIYLAFFRGIFGTQSTNYLFWAVFGQSILSAVATYSLAKYIIKEFKINIVLGYLIMLMPLFTSLLCRFVAGRAAMYSNSILTEGLSISIYMLFIRFCTEYILKNSKKSFFASAILTFIGISLRKQMYILFVIFFATMLIVSVKEGKKTKLQAITKTFVTSILILATVYILDHCYTFAVWKVWDGHMEDNRFVTTVALYTAQRDYVQYIDPDLQGIFLEIYDTCDENGWLMSAAPSGWMEEVAHFGNNYDYIQLDTMEQLFIKIAPDYVWKYPGVEYEKIMDLIRAEFNRALLPHEIREIVKVTWNNFLSGLVNTVAVRNYYLCIYSVIVYTIYILLMINLIIKGIKTKWTMVNKGVCIFAMLTIASIIGNVLLVSLVIFTQTRYMIYNMPIFYMSFICMFDELVKIKKKLINNK